MIRVLMVDDEPLVRHGVAAGMDWASLGCEVVGEAVRLLFREKIRREAEVRPVEADSFFGRAFERQMPGGRGLNEAVFPGGCVEEKREVERRVPRIFPLEEQRFPFGVLPDDQWLVVERSKRRRFRREENSGDHPDRLRGSDFEAELFRSFPLQRKTGDVKACGMGLLFSVPGDRRVPGVGWIPPVAAVEPRPDRNPFDGAVRIFRAEDSERPPLRRSPC